MPVENAPISSFLRKIVYDPATTKLLTILFSTILIVVTTERTRNVWHMVCLLAIYSSALIYSIISLFVVTFDMQDKIGESTCLKKIFCGRKIYWHEIQACASFILAVTQLSTITLAFAGEINRTETHVIFTILNIILFTMEWYFATKTGKSFVLEENFRSSRNCLEIILSPFHCFPTFFNLVRKALFIASVILIAKSSIILSYMNVYYFHCMAFAIIASFLLFIIQICNLCKKRTSSTCKSGCKGQTYLMLIITTHAFLAVLCLSLVNGYRHEQTEVRDYQPLYNYTETRHYPVGYMDLDQINNIKPTIDHFGGPTPPPSARFSKYTISPHFYAPTEIPIPFILTCVGLILSFMDLYSRTICSQSVTNHNDITIPDNNAITTPLHIHDGITKIEDLPIVVAHPHNFTPLKNCI